MIKTNEPMMIVLANQSVGRSAAALSIPGGSLKVSYLAKARPLVPNR
jgi:hypothetical protein